MWLEHLMFVNNKHAWQAISQYITRQNCATKLYHICKQLHVSPKSLLSHSKGVKLFLMQAGQGKRISKKRAIILIKQMNKNVYL